MLSELLFVGGPCDGARIEVEDGMRHVWIRDGKTNGTVEYRREKLAEGIKKYDIMFYGADGRGVIEALLAGYRGRTQK